MKTPIHPIYLMSAATLLLLSACASSKITEASLLGKTGAEISTNARKPIAAMRNQVADYHAIKPIADMVRGIGPVSEQQDAAVESIQKSLKIREQVLVQLNNTYGSMAALADYKAGDTISAEVKGLTGAINTFAKATGHASNPISDVVATALEQGVKAVTEEAQLRMLRAASAEIRPRVAKFRAVLEADKNKHESMIRTIANSKANIFASIIRKTPAAATPFLEKELAKLGLSAEDETVKLIFGNPAADAEPTQETIDLLKGLKKNQLDGISTKHVALYDATIVALTKLEAAHVTFEGETRMNPNALLDQAKLLSELAQAYEKAVE